MVCGSQACSGPIEENAMVALHVMTLENYAALGKIVYAWADLRSDIFTETFALIGVDRNVARIATINMGDVDHYVDALYRVAEYKALNPTFLEQIDSFGAELEDLQYRKDEFLNRSIDLSLPFPTPECEEIALLIRSLIEQFADLSEALREEWYKPDNLPPPAL
jgi:hypothetical protein